MASMHIDNGKLIGSSDEAEVPPTYEATSDAVFDERISHVAAKYRGTATDEHGQS